MGMALARRELPSDGKVHVGAGDHDLWLETCEPIVRAPRALAEPSILSDIEFQIEPTPTPRGSKPSESLPGFVRQIVEDEECLTIIVEGDLHLDQAPALWKLVTAVQRRAKLPRHVRVDLAATDKADGACLALIVHLGVALKKRRTRLELVGIRPELQALVDLYQRAKVRGRSNRRPHGAVEQIGDAAANALETTRAALGFFGELILTVWTSIRHRRGVNFRDMTLTMERSGADALPIVLLINFLVGFVMAYQSAPQLREFGANILVADLVGLAMVRELGPLMTSIIICGRSGAAFAAELGTMKVSEEVDALRTFGFSAMGYLVLPRVLGLVLVAPLLTLAADFVGIFGGLLVGLIELDLTSDGFLTEITRVVKVRDVASGLAKSVIFGFAIGLIACERGLSTRGGAAEVGRRTTSAVVIILFSLIILDALFTVILKAFSL
jgi:phospholipid/cholesterol/gamma-HCH transport system permease protein